MNKMEWSKSLIQWRDDSGVAVSVPFTWMIPEARTLCQWWRDSGEKVMVGGPAVDLMPQLFYDCADDVGGQMCPGPLTRHNPFATFTTRGCIRNCHFCAVPKIEGEFRELDEWQPAPIICDNNLLASSMKHFDLVIDREKLFSYVDFNQGLDCRLLKTPHLDRIRELHLPMIRFAWDWAGTESQVMDAIKLTLESGIPKKRIGVYVLIGHTDSPDDALYRFETLKKMGIRANPMRYQPLDIMVKDSYVPPGWTQEELRKMMRYWARQNWLSKIPYSEYKT